MMTFAAALQGCMLAPGQHMSTGNFMRGEDDKVRVEIIPITPKLIAMNEAGTVASDISPQLLAYQPEPYRIGIGDTLYVTVWDHPELTSPAGPQQQPLANGHLVGSDGTLFYPYVGELKVIGMTLEALRRTISEKLARYVQKPQVDVNVLGYGSQHITLRGAFLKTDPLPFTAAPMTLAQALGTAGVDAGLANLSGFVLTRDGHDYPIDLDALMQVRSPARDIFLKPGDHLFLPYNDRQEVYVMGEVNRAQAISFKIGQLSLTQVLGRCGGLNQATAKGKAVYVIRGMKDLEKSKGKVYQLNAREPDAFILADQFKIEPGDVVFVGPSDVTRWNRFLSQLLPLSGIVSNAADVRYNLAR